MLQNLVDRFRRDPRYLDSSYALLLAPFTLGTAAALFPSWLNAGTPVNSLIMLVWTASYLVPLVWRRTAPDLAALGIIPAHLFQLTTGNPQFGNLTVPIMMYAVAAYGRPEWSRRWLFGGLAASVVAALNWQTPRVGVQSPPGWVFGTIIAIGFCAASVAAAWFMGSLRRSRAAEVAALHDRAASLERERDKALRLAATEERQRIAREMHDVVAHSLSVIVVQSDGAHYVVAEAPGTPEQRLAQAEKAIATIQATARTALTETRRLVGVLHSDQGAELAPAASLGDVPALVKNLTDAGRHATLTVTGAPDAHAPLGQVGELTAYRIVQESLTNVMKHAGPGASAHVTLAHSPVGLTVAVRDDGRGAGASDGQGHGLLGMRERVQAVGGSLTTRTLPSGGFEVTALIPAPDKEIR